eukprot:g29795.t1
MDWTILKNPADNLGEYATSVTDFISTCVEGCMPKKSISVFPNQKIWNNQEIHCLLKTRLRAECQKHGATCPNKPGAPIPSITAADIRLVFLRVNLRKATGPDRDPGHAFRSYMHQLTEVFTDIFNLSLLQAEVPTCFKKTTIVSISKETHATCPNDYRLVALTSIILKYFERVVLRKFGMSIRTLTNVYSCTIESILSRCIMAWYVNYSAQDWKKLQKVVHTAQTITEVNLPSMDSIYTSRCRRKAANIKDPSHL